MHILSIHRRIWSSVRVAVKIEHLQDLSYTTNPENQHFSTITQILAGEMIRKQLIRMQPSLGPEASCPGTTKLGDQTGNQQLRHVTHILDQSLSTTYIILRQSYDQVTKIPGQAPHITAEYSADIRNRTPLDRVFDV